MALTNCEDCGREVSTAASACPNCGRPINQAVVQPPVAVHPPVAPSAPAPKRRRWPRRHPILTGIGVLIILGAIGSAFGHGSGSGSSSAGSASDLSAPASVPITGRVSGALQDPTMCLGCGSLTRYIHIDRIWCGWQGNQVIVHARFRNDSVEHVTIHWHPSYTIAGGGSHGGGLTSIQSLGLDAHATRASYVKQSPKGVAAESAIDTCEPALEDISSG